MFQKILIANRGEIACRVIRTARRMGIVTVAVYSDADANALHVREADEAIRIGPPPATQSYIDIENVVGAIRESGADAVHPGYGFLSENALFAERLAEAGIAFIGPPASAIRAMGDKITSKKLADEAGVSTVPGHMGIVADADEAATIAAQIGYPVMIKASAGGGGKGMRIAWNDAEARQGFASSRSEAAASFGDDRIFIEKFVTDPRHIEIQVLADAHGNCIYLGERECSIQRRNQKVIEEAPSPFLDETTRRAMGEQACALAQAVGYTSAGTVEFIADGERNFYFLEMNTRLQVEHPVTELVTGIDLVEQMIRVAAGEPLKVASVTQSNWEDDWIISKFAENPKRGASRDRFDLYENGMTVGEYVSKAGTKGRLDIRWDLERDLVRINPPSGLFKIDKHLKGWSIESRLYAEDPYRNFLPSIGRLSRYRPPEEGPRDGGTIVRNDTGVFEGGEISMHYDPMIAKLCTWGPDRRTAISAMSDALDRFEVEGIGHNVPFLSAVMEHPRFVSGEITTAFIAEEFPDGFDGVELSGDRLREVAATVACMNAIAQLRRTRISGALDNHKRRVGRDWIVTLDEREFRLRMKLRNDGATVRFRDEDGNVTHKLKVDTDWRPGQPLCEARIRDRSQNGAKPPDRHVAMKVAPIPTGWTIRWRGATVRATVLTPRMAQLARMMPEKAELDTSAMLLCPMPGLVTAISVAEGDAVEAGQALATVEAMKMENVLRAERKGRVSKVLASAGDSLAVDDVIMEFEA